MSRGIQKLIDKYNRLLNNGYETIYISQVVNDLRNIRRVRYKKKQESEK